MDEMAKWRRHKLEIKQQVVERMKSCDNIEALARELKIQRKLLYTWKWQLEGRPEAKHANLAETAEGRKQKQLQEENSQLKAALAEKTVENRFFKLALLKIKERRQRRDATVGSASMKSSGRGRRSKAR